MLAIVLIPSAALMIIGVGGSGYMVNQGYNAQNWATLMQDTVEPGTEFVTLATEERRLSLHRLGGDESVVPELQKSRAEFDKSLANIQSLSNSLKKLNPEAMAEGNEVFAKLLGKLPEIRKGVDAGVAPKLDTYQYYNTLTEVIKQGLQGLAETAPDPKTAVEESTSTTLFAVADSMSRAHALAASEIVSGNISPEAYQEISRHVGRYHTAMEQVTPILTPALQKRYAELTKTPEFQQLNQVETALLHHGPGPDVPEIPISIQKWQQDSKTVNAELLAIYEEHHHYAEGFAADTGATTFRNSLIAGGVVVLIALIAAFVAARLSSRVVQRMKRLRDESLDLADHQLPDIMDRLRKGERVDVRKEVRPLDFGRDELGEVAEAFNRAESAAVGAAVEEANTRAGINALFLNIAHRSQVVVHRQLEALDRAEHKEEDPDRLAVLFKLDNLATRARRNAENLMLLGGEEPSRKWRNPVPLSAVIRGAISETEEYARVQVGRISKISVVGSVVADLIHLVAELVENATSFSPPESRVEVTGMVVGRGVCVEITDQGLGMATEQLEQTNALLQAPPSFGVEDLSQDSRMGLLVVSQIAQRHELSVRLRESDYGGIRAIVLVPTSLTVREEEPAALTTGGAGVDNGAGNAPVPSHGRSNGHIGQPLGRHDAARGNVPSTHGGNVRGEDHSRESRPDAEQHGQAPRTPPQPPPPHQRGPNEQAARSQSGTIPPSTGASSNPPGQTSAPYGNANPTEDRPSLPRRRKQANLASPLATGPQTPANPTQGQGTPENGQQATPRNRSSEQVRDMFSAIETGTRRGRSAPVAGDGNDNDRREG